MDGFSLTTNINKSPKVVFAFLAEVTNMTRWYEAVEQVALDPDSQIGKGARFQLIRSLPGGPAVNVVEITEFDPDRRLTLESRSGPTPYRYAYTLDTVEEGVKSYS